MLLVMSESYIGRGDVRLQVEGTDVDGVFLHKAIHCPAAVDWISEQVVSAFHDQ